MKTYEVSSVMYIELLSCNPTTTTILNLKSLFKRDRASLMVLYKWKRYDDENLNKEFGDNSKCLHLFFNATLGCYVDDILPHRVRHIWSMVPHQKVVCALVKIDINFLFVSVKTNNLSIFLSIFLPHVHVSLVRKHTYLGQGREIRPHYYV